MRAMAICSVFCLANLWCDSRDHAVRGDEPIATKDDVAASGGMTTAEWRQQILRWRAWLRPEFKGDDDLVQRPELARENILAIRDPRAMPVLVNLVENDKDFAVRMLCLKAIGQIGGKEAVAPLVRISVLAEFPDLRWLAAESLGKLEMRADAIPLYVKYLASSNTSAAAADALLRTGLADPPSDQGTYNPRLVNGLIAALVRKERKLVPYEYEYDTGWQIVRGVLGPNGGRAWGIERGYVPIYESMPNQSALTALNQYTGQDYGFDQSIWKKWLQENQQ